eukprot:scpid60689/ scgid7193/ 
MQKDMQAAQFEHDEKMQQQWMEHENKRDAERRKVEAEIEEQRKTNEEALEERRLTFAKDSQKTDAHLLQQMQEQSSAHTQSLQLTSMKFMAEIVKSLKD